MDVDVRLSVHVCACWGEGVWLGVELCVEGRGGCSNIVGQFLHTKTNGAGTGAAFGWKKFPPSPTFFSPTPESFRHYTRKFAILGSLAAQYFCHSETSIDHILFRLVKLFAKCKACETDVRHALGNIRCSAAGRINSKFSHARYV